MATNIGDGIAVAAICLCITIVAVLFGGTPDLMDAIIARLSRP